MIIIAIVIGYYLLNSSNFLGTVPGISYRVSRSTRLGLRRETWGCCYCCYQRVAFCVVSLPVYTGSWAPKSVPKLLSFKSPSRRRPFSAA